MKMNALEILLSILSILNVLGLGHGEIDCVCNTHLDEGVIYKCPQPNDILAYIYSHTYDVRPDPQSIYYAQYTSNVHCRPHVPALSSQLSGWYAVDVEGTIGFIRRSEGIEILKCRQNTHPISALSTAKSCNGISLQHTSPTPAPTSPTTQKPTTPTTQKPTTPTTQKPTTPTTLKPTTPTTHKPTTPTTQKPTTPTTQKPTTPTTRKPTTSTTQKPTTPTTPTPTVLHWKTITSKKKNVTVPGRPTPTWITVPSTPAAASTANVVVTFSATVSCNQFKVGKVLQLHRTLEHALSRSCPSGKNANYEAPIHILCRAPHIGQWIQGKKVKDNCNFIPPYTPISAYDANGQLMGGDGTSILTGCLPGGFKVARQSCKSQVFEEITIMQAQAGDILTDPDIYYVFSW